MMRQRGVENQGEKKRAGFFSGSRLARAVFFLVVQAKRSCFLPSIVVEYNRKLSNRLPFAGGALITVMEELHGTTS
jgi:hypothetical protein